MVDLAWLRTTPWRERLAASFDLPSRLTALRHIAELEIRHQERSSASSLLLAGWLASRLDWDRARLEGGIGMLTGTVARARRRGRRSRCARSSRSRRASSGSPSPARRGRRWRCSAASAASTRPSAAATAQQREWKILGASRGEGGILGEGVRQALLRDPTYVGALDAARELCPV